MIRFVALIISMMTFSASCTQPTPIKENQNKAFLSYSLDFTLKAQFRNLANESIDLKLVYKRESKKQEYLLSHLEKHPTQTILLMLYLNNCAYDFLKKGHHYPNVSISHSGSKQDLINKAWLRKLDSKTFYDKKTLALKSDATLILFDNQTPSDEWLLLNEKSYSQWWDRLNKKFSLEDRFGRPLPNI